MLTKVRKRCYCPKCNANPKQVSILFYYRNDKKFSIAIQCFACKNTFVLEEIKNKKGDD